MQKDLDRFDVRSVPDVMEDLVAEVWSFQGNPDNKTTVHQRTDVFEDGECISAVVCKTHFISGVQLEFGKSVACLKGGSWVDFRRLYRVTIESDDIREKIESVIDLKAQRFLKVQKFGGFSLSEVIFVENLRRERSELALELSHGFDVPNRILNRVRGNCGCPEHEVYKNDISLGDLIDIALGVRKILVELLEEELIFISRLRSLRDFEAYRDHSSEEQLIGMQESVPE